MYDELCKIWKKNGIDSFCFETKEEAADFLCKKLVNRSITFGGCHTAEEMGLYEKLEKNNEVFWHWRNNDYEAKRRAELKGDVYICSANGVAETGEIVNIDGSCNRISNSTYAQDLSIFIIGKNKIEPTIEKAIWRARNIAAPLNARRQHMKTPCAFGEMKCHNCSSPERICHVMSIIWQKPIPMDQMWVILVNEDLGY